MKLKTVYEQKDQIPEKFQELFAERDGKWELVGVEGIKTEADVDRLNSSLSTERDAHKETKKQLAAWASLGKKPEEVKTMVEEYPELKVRAEGNKIDDAKINTIVEARVKSQLGPIQLELKEANEKVETLTKENTDFKVRDDKRTIGDAIRAADAVGKFKLQSTAVEDALEVGSRMLEIVDGKVVTKAEVGVTPGVGAEVWLKEMMDKRPHWWPPSEGGGAGGAGGAGVGGDNPFSAKSWNKTAQSTAVKASPEKAAQLAKSAGFKDLESAVRATSALKTE